MVRELLSTEESFVSQLEEIRDIFMTPLRASGALSELDHRTLFSNVPLLLNLHTGLRDDLVVICFSNLVFEFALDLLYCFFFFLTPINSIFVNYFF